MLCVNCSTGSGALGRGIYVAWSTEITFGIPFSSILIMVNAI